MSSPFARKAQQLAAEAALPDTNWLNKRQEAIDGHQPSIETGLQTLGDMAVTLLDGRISTDLRVEHALDIENRQPAESLGYVACSVIPALRGATQNIPLGRGHSWTPDVALQLTLSFKDKYDPIETTAGRQLQPKGEVALFMHARTWGRVSEGEADAIGQLGENVWITYGDNGYSRNGTHVQAVYKPGELLTREAAETMLAPLASHVIDYFALTNKKHLAEWQRPGNFSDRDRQSSTPDPSSRIDFDVERMIGPS